MTKLAVAEKPESLDVRIAALLKSPEGQPSDAFVGLLVEVGVAIDTAEQEARTAHARSIDPTILDGTALGKAHDAEYQILRLQNAATALTKLHDAAVSREQSAAWSAEADRIQAERDKLAAQFRTRWPQLVQEVVDLFSAIATCDKAIDRLHGGAPEANSGRRLRKVEAEARDIPSVAGDSSIIATVRLPKFSQHGVTLAWPIWQAPLSIALTEGMFPKNGASGPDDDAFYEAFFDEAAGHFSMRRKSDAPPLAPPAAPVTDAPQLAAAGG